MKKFLSTVSIVLSISILMSLGGCAISSRRRAENNGGSSRSSKNKDDDEELVKGTDYTVQYRNNDRTGTASILFLGKG